MKRIFLALALVSTQAIASSPPVSGTFSNASEDARNRTFNLVVVANERGQEFYIQCFKEGKTGFGTLTRLPKAKQTAMIRADSSCPASKIEVDLDYEEAYVRIGRERIALPRREIHVPIVD
jgi:hypothetical protein